ncbi:hypothetical protein [Pseudomarimonas salicorniae]|uniref:SpoIIAA-like n=1 Tax=Pseudomarimonas salicorniae TaxID=2933270 RepID=A0ABT0GHI2_9GAMM|nr:hypothetical protein [Lysobacter sp. CAU 1642]MCK7594006.1 hypothetical protein [Lysobacter sp. CAU 1642]
MNRPESQFSAHGLYDIRVRGQLLHIDATGPWNEQAAQFFCEHTRPAVMAAQFDGEPWAMLVDLHGEALYTPGSLPALIELHRWRVAMGLRLIAIVHAPDAVAQGVTRSQFDQVYAAGPDSCVARYFNDRDAALDWLESAGFDPSQLR